VACRTVRRRQGPAAGVGRRLLRAAVGELAALRWSNVDLQGRTLRVARACSEEAPRGELSPVKNHQARTVPIPAIVSVELADYKAQCDPDGLVFPSVAGTPRRNRNWRRDVFDSAVEALE
jgi:integrase